MNPYNVNRKLRHSEPEFIPQTPPPVGAPSARWSALFTPMALMSYTRREWGQRW